MQQAETRMEIHPTGKEKEKKNINNMAHSRFGKEGMLTCLIGGTWTLH